ncbi:cobyrinate a,c-diamide synthase [Allorhizobium sp. BGMRC 0089]|uniref:cobyrinate a,c-diamide synthase n=1 Tax=Allorhizobium sonneratiae TaxID=2934936 RepID=UPI00203467CA|nr:cobyrinate a,c-diamide synthase [Allorhizobium sonneratiae]MCM2293583.1 cobyrinate a,c-diamide synthase [Allorhizobium sonneratiae]
MSGLMIAAPASGSGKTTVTLGLLRALKHRGVALAPGKAGPDYIDPAFHTAACGESCLNFDPWAMRDELLLANAALHVRGGKILIVEAMMGLHDGAADGCGTPADLAALLGLSVVLVVDCARMSHSVAALVKGYADFRADLVVAGVILNRVGSARHEAMLRQALERIAMPVLGGVPACEALKLPERHLGLVQATEHDDLEGFIERAARIMEANCDLDRLLMASRQSPMPVSDANIVRLPPLGQKVAVAKDAAFAFSYPHMLLSWRRRGAEISFFSPLDDEAPPEDADAIYLPGGYPELHAGRLVAAERFRTAMQTAAQKGTVIYGECGGYMVLGDSLTDAANTTHPMLGLLPVQTSFAMRQRHLGYRRLTPLTRDIFTRPMTAHEFHYSTLVFEGEAERLFEAEDALGQPLGPVGLKRGRVAGSYMHLIDLAGEAGA